MIKPNGPRVPEAIVCLGASAGGLPSLQAVLGALPEKFPWPVLIALHVKPAPTSILPDVLSRATALHVKEAREGEVLQPGVVYVSPSDVEMGVTPDFRIATRSIPRGRPQRIDFLFSTCAAVARAQTVAVVLSGEGSDGAAGALVVKLNGGTVIAEREASALHRSMPHAAAAASTVDAFRHRDEIGRLLLELADGRLREANDVVRRGIARVVEAIVEENGPDFARYRRGTLTRRIQKRMAICGFTSPEEYRERLLADPAERDALRQSLLVLVTEFFRDPETWRLVAERVIPALSARIESGAPLRVWSAGCATGEEAYTIAVLLCEAFPMASAATVQIVATDLDAASLDHGRAGLYHEARLRNVPAPLLSRYFDPRGTSFRVDEGLRAMVSFEQSDLTREAPPGPFDLILCRNVLIYFDEELQARVFARFNERLAPGGFLVLGTSETPPRQQAGFLPIAGKARIFVKNGSEDERPPALADFRGRDGAPARGETPSGSHHRFIGDALMGSKTILALVVDEHAHVLAVNRLGRALLPLSSAGSSLADGADPRLRETVRLAIASGRSAQIDAVDLDHGRDLRFDLTIEPLPKPERAALLIGSASPPRSAAKPSQGRPGDPETLADLLATNEELQAANEELAATNEELQSANEELASLNEEFQSNNEVLDTRNLDLEAGEAASTTRNLLLRAVVTAGRLAIVACDAHQRVVLCTAQAARLLGLSGETLGRPVVEIALPAPPQTIHAWLEQTRRDRSPVQIDLHGPDARPLQVRIEHVEGQNGATAGWVLAWRETPQG